ncbi:hypothetical protein IE81DRAFT_58749 [Ceraceosorus guamensis]|uniref:Uncharacterized protein n=1 Tax=Ceraceosorus guamensis TaxID=1522189 RepID=A0A316W1W9_9BASI|nr:hypothetical protein IE81DRAFT_58749 [Ceraceosorus guamensis]PWN43780.1 hypothetical protein IE81DRAFT_58749 [Ceraceosorus guamensis]
MSTRDIYPTLVFAAMCGVTLAAPSTGTDSALRRGEKIRGEDEMSAKMAEVNASKTPKKRASEHSTGQDIASTDSEGAVYLHHLVRAPLQESASSS